MTGLTVKEEEGIYKYRWMERPLISRHYSLSFINYKNFHKTTYPN